MKFATIVDRMIGTISPRWQLGRMQARATMKQMNEFTGANGPGGYDAGKSNRLNGYRRRGPANENAVPRYQLQELRQRSWDVYRNNAYARKIVRSIESKVVGRGMYPSSQATHADGTPHVEFRERAEKLWREMSVAIDFRGTPGRGGQDLCELLKLALRCTILGGESLARLVPCTTKEQRKRGLPVPMLLQLVDSDRLAADAGTATLPDGHQFYRGIRLDADGRPVAYGIMNASPGEMMVASTDPTSLVDAVAGTLKWVPVQEMLHLFVGDDVDQLRGVPWFAPALMPMRDSGDYQYNTLKSSALAACVALGIRRAAGQSTFGVTVNGNSALEDRDGNPITAMQPGMVVDLGKEGEMDGFSPTQPATNAEGFIQHILRAVAAAMPGTKSSTVTGDYRNASFSSERAADNDTWPEIESLQDWFCNSLVQPLFEAIVEAGILSGYFDGIVTSAEFNERRASLLQNEWQGPVMRSVNPVQDVTAAEKRIALGISSPQIEIAKLGGNWRNVLRQLAEFIKTAIGMGIPERIVMSMVGVKETGTAVEDGTDEGTTPAPAASPNKPATAPEDSKTSKKHAKNAQAA